MKKFMPLIWAMIMVSPASYASDVLEFNVVGSIISTTCNIKTPSQTVNLGAWQTHSASGIGSGIGSKSDMVGFTLDFDCPQGLAITGQLEGNQYETSNIYNIALEKSEHSATGVTIEMHYYSGSRWMSLVYGSPRTLISSTTEGINSVKLRAYYYQMSSMITSGIANSSVTLTIEYQ